MLVLDASVVVPAVQFDNGFSIFRREELAAPPFMWAEVRSALHEAVWRGELSARLGSVALERLDDAPVKWRTHRRLSRESWMIADEFGWAKTYDADYIALARLLRCRLVTVDDRLRRGADRLGFVIGPSEL
ncbi:MAG: type II toxin-antitoxin system VapC family toxin [Actinomycetota bacterium]